MPLPELADADVKPGSITDRKLPTDSWLGGWSFGACSPVPWRTHVAITAVVW